MLIDFKKYYKAMMITKVWYWLEICKNRLVEQKRKFTIDMYR